MGAPGLVGLGLVRLSVWTRDPMMKFSIEAHQAETMRQYQDAIESAVREQMRLDHERIERVCELSLYFGVGVFIERDEYGRLVDVRLNPDVPYRTIYEYNPRASGAEYEDD